MSELKDDVLDRIAERANIAQFVSFSPTLDVHHLRVKDPPARSGEVTAEEAIELVLRRSSSGNVNVRAFTPDRPKGNPFHYGLDSVEAVLAQLGELSRAGFFTIVNETIDVHDGGVSGVRLGDVVEFAPNSTPRVVEEAGVLSAPARFADRFLRVVYQSSLPSAELGTRVEFSVHPRGVGLRDERLVVWEAQQDTGSEVHADLTWPNRFSEHIGDKTFGLLVADALGIRVPLVHVIARSTPPFSFGRPTGHDAIWVRTAPRRFAAGRYTTVHGWADPFALLAKEDPDGNAIGAVLVQEGVRARWSGAARSDADHAVVEGVAGRGDDFMLGARAPSQLPPDVHVRVQELCRVLVSELGPVRLEWADDGRRAWVLQLNQLSLGHEASVGAGAATDWFDYDPRDGLDALVGVIERAKAAGKGVRVVRPVGVTSHVGDVLRQAGVPARFANSRP
jgi:hypothetical protein